MKNLTVGIGKVVDRESLTEMIRRGTKDCCDELCRGHVLAHVPVRRFTRVAAPVKLFAFSYRSPLAALPAAHSGDMFTGR